MTVCSGSMLLAAAGLLDGRPATTNKALFNEITELTPAVKWVKQARWVDDGNIVTASGVSAGIDMALAVVAREFGQEQAELLAELTEYEWHRDPDWDPFARVHGLVD
jgi:transcriptional regulator GlxA family with amidase domain